MRKVGLIAFLTLVVLFVLGAPALAEKPPPPSPTSSAIYNDFVLNYPKLAGDYTEDQLRAFLTDAAERQSCNPRILSKLDRYIEKVLNTADTGDDDDDGDGSPSADNQSGKGGGTYSPYQVVGGHSIPFSMVGVALILVAGTAIVGGGVALRRFTH